MNSVRYINIMWVQACDRIERADRLHRQFFRLGQVGQVAAWEPPVDIFESDDGLLIRAAVPDIHREDFQIRLEGNMLRMSGQRCVPPQAARQRIRQLEIPYGFMQRDVRLPAGQYRLESHTYSNGCLEIYLHRLNDNE